ncbi:MAG TPA: nucleotide exchange factor GrpE [Clostridia bacterium]|nr:nucleotide exchange factor GrpE [Clostridia bacterium]
MSDRKEHAREKRKGTDCASNLEELEMITDSEDLVEVATEQNEIEKQAKEICELNDRYLRVCADYDNFRRRSRLDKAASYDEGVMETIRLLMPVVDSVDCAIKAADSCLTDEAREFAEGVILIAQQLDEVFRRLGVTEIDGVGSNFDPNFHQVVVHEEDEDEPDNYVAEVYQKGYRKGDRVIRHSMVKVIN